MVINSITRSTGHHALSKYNPEAPPMRLPGLPEDFISDADSLADVVFSRTTSGSAVSRTTSASSAGLTTGLSRTSSAESAAWSETSNCSTRRATKNVRDAAASALGAVSWLLESVERERRVHSEHGKASSGSKMVRAAQVRSATQTLEQIVCGLGEGRQRKTSRMSSS